MNCLLACLPDTDKKIFCVSLLKTVLLFLTNQAPWCFDQFCSRGIADLNFSREFHVVFPWMNLSKIFDKTIGGEYNLISLHFGRLPQYVLFFISKHRYESFRKSIPNFFFFLWIPRDYLDGSAKEFWENHMGDDFGNTYFFYFKA